jgi:transcriptional regulator with XRE-family HTH domain
METVFSKWLKGQIFLKFKTAEEFAIKAGTNSGTLSKHLSGERTPRPTLLKKYATVLDTPYEAMLLKAGYFQFDKPIKRRARLFEIYALLSLKNKVDLYTIAEKMLDRQEGDKMELTVGKPLFGRNEFRPQGIVFEMTASGATFIITYDKPTDDELKAAKKGEVKISFMEMDNVLMNFIHIKNLGRGWMDAPFNVNLCKTNRADLPLDLIIEKTMALGFLIVFVESAGSIVRNIRLVSGTNRYSNALIAAINKQYDLPFNIVQYDNNIDSIFRLFTTEQLVKRASYYFKAGDTT